MDWFVFTIVFGSIAASVTALVYGRAGDVKFNKWRRRHMKTYRAGDVKFNKWRRRHMKTYRIEIKAHFAEKEKEEAIMQACREAARNILGTAVLLSEKSHPEAVFETEDFIEGVSVHDISDD